MMERGRMRTWGLAAAGLGAVGVVAAIGYGLRPSKPSPVAAGVAATASTVTAKSPIRDLSRAIARGDGLAMAILKNRLEEKPEVDAEGQPKPAEPMTEAEAADIVDALASLRTGIAKFSAYGRASAVVVASGLLHKLDAAPAPQGWIHALKPSSEVFAAALVDQVWEVRVAALGEAKGFWKWTPRRDLRSNEVDDITAWKGALYNQVLPRLTDGDPKARTAAVACLGALPLNRGAEPASRLITDTDPGVRLQVLISFSDRPALLSEEAILPLLYDANGLVPPLAERILKSRGLSPDQIGLGKLVAHPRADMRASAIPFLKDRKDIDPVLWLVYLSRDSDESVRLSALEALAGRDAPEARQRVSEMASGDVSAKVRQAAEKHVPAGESTAALPPLPGSGAGLKLKAN